jgi:IS605 OrfB family transposase
MRLTATVKLNTTPEQHEQLKQTLLIANSACNYISEQAWQNQVFSQFSLHKLLYNSVRQKYPISAQLAVRCIGKVADSYKLDKKTQRVFNSLGAIPYDDRILTWRTDKQFVNIRTIDNRIKIPYSCGELQKHYLQFQQGESDLVFYKNEFYLYTTCNIPDQELLEPNDIIGIDLGIVNIAVSSDKQIFSGNVINAVRARYRKIRQKLQKKNTKSAKKLLKKRSRKEHNFAKNVNHIISKQIVAMAKDTNRAIALEDLTGIGSRTTVMRKSQRATHSSWSFYQLRQFIEYKAKMLGIPVFFVNPRNTSRTCPSCGCIDKKNRKTQELFKCITCGFSELADYTASLNIKARASVNMPYASNCFAV